MLHFSNGEGSKIVWTNRFLTVNKDKCAYFFAF